MSSKTLQSLITNPWLSVRILMNYQISKCNLKSICLFALETIVLIKNLIHEKLTLYSWKSRTSRHLSAQN